MHHTTDNVIIPHRRVRGHNPPKAHPDGLRPIRDYLPAVMAQIQQQQKKHLRET